MDPTGKRAAIYCRISRDEAGTGQKVEDQERDCRALAERMGLEVSEDRIFVDNDIAATRASRRGRVRRRWYDLLDAIRAGQVDVVLATCSPTSTCASRGACSPTPSAAAIST